MMRIEDFPRPKDDNGRGVHWSARLYHDVVQPSLEYWIDQLQQMKIKWVKVLDDGGGSSFDFCRLLVAADIMPVVRFYLVPPNPNRLRSRQLDTISRLVDEGVFYFESNNEPDLPAEWENNHMPSNWLDIVVDNFIRDADGVLGRGGHLALPAMGPGSRDNPIAKVVQRGRRDLFENGCWVAIHNYTLNHPLDYPDDDVNQQGRPLTQEEFDQYAQWAYSHLTYQQIVAQGIPISEADYAKYNNWAWDWRNMQMVNDERLANQNPGDTVFDDPNCFRGWEAAGKMMFDALGFHVPVISTEGGPVVGWGDDKRYAKVNPTTHMEWQLDIVRFMQSQAPPWYFSCCTWLLASRPLGDFNPTWEQMSWYTHAWDQQFGLSGQTPVVQALKDEPALIRPELRPGSGVIGGTVRRDDGRPVAALPLRLVGESRNIPTATDGTGAYRYEGLAAGVYDLLTGDMALVTAIELAEDEQKEVDITLSAGQQSAISGLVTDAVGTLQRGLAVTLGRGEEQVATVTTGSDGRYRVEGLPVGSYWVITGDGAAAVAGIQLDGWNHLTIDLTVPAPPGFRYVVTERRLLDPAETGNNRKFYGRVFDAAGAGLNGIRVEMAWINAVAGTQFPRQTTPKDAFKPAGNFEFLHSPGEFMLRIVQGDWPSEEATGLRTAGIPGREGQPITWEVNFQLQPVGGDGTGQIEGVITDGAGLGLTLWLGPRSWAAVLPADGSYSFSGLPAGQYSVTLEGEGEVGQVELGEGEQATFNYTAQGWQPPTTGAIAGTLNTAAGQPVIDQRLLLNQDGAFVTQQFTDAAGRFHFDALLPGVYRIDLPDGRVLVDNINVFAGETAVLALTLPGPPSDSAVQGVLAYSDGRPAAGLNVWVSDATGQMTATVSADDGAYRLAGLPAGTYDLFLEHPDAGQLTLETGLVLDGVSTVVRDFTALEPPLATKALPAYMLFGARESDRLLVDVALPYLRANRLTAGFTLSEAAHAVQVSIVGGEAVASAADEQALRDSGCLVRRLPEDPFALAQALGQ